ncbi:MAG: hypothetical protein ABJY83_04790 [Roseibium sp.]
MSKLFNLVSWAAADNGVKASANAVIQFRKRHSGFAVDVFSYVSGAAKIGR